MKAASTGRGTMDATLLLINLSLLLLTLVFWPLHYLAIEQTINQHLPNSRSYDCGMLLNPNPRPSELRDADEQNARLYPQLIAGKPSLVSLCHDALTQERQKVIAASLPAIIVLSLIVLVLVRLRPCRRRSTERYPPRLLFISNRFSIPAICALVVLSVLGLVAVSV